MFRPTEWMLLLSVIALGAGFMVLSCVFSSLTFTK